MLLTITTNHQPATDLGYLLHKHPDRCQSFPLSFGQAHIFYPEASIERCTAALLLDIDPVKLVRGRGSTIGQYVSDRPYVASSFLSVAIAQVLGTALNSRCKELPELVQTPIPLTAELSVLPCRGGEGFLRQLFEPLGYSVSAQGHILDEKFPDWGQSIYYTVQLQHTITLAELLSHLYVLIPVLDDDKHYFVGEGEIDKLLRHGEGWLSKHPAQEQIIQRYLKRQQKLTRIALAQLVEEDEPDPDKTAEQQAEAEAAIEKPLSLNQQRLDTVVAVLKEKGAKRIVDLGCGQGNLLKKLAKDIYFQAITGVDVSYRALSIADERLDRLPSSRSVQLIQGSLTYKDKRLTGYDAATVIEVIEHLDLPRLSAFARVLFEFAQPKTIVLTTPNIEYNVKFASLTPGKLRHQDHRFEWTREEFKNWAEEIAEKFSYTVEFRSVGDDDPEVGSPTQMGIFSLR